MEVPQLREMLEDFWHLKFRNNLTFNVDENGYSDVQRHSHIVSLSSPDKVGMATSFAKGRNNSLCCATNGRGLFLPPTYVCYRLRMTPLLHERGPPLSICAWNQFGWRFFHFLSPTFRVQFQSSIQNLTLLITVEYSSHCKENWIFCTRPTKLISWKFCFVGR